MKATIKIEYSKENWAKVHAILELLQMESESYDAQFENLRVVKGRQL